MTERRFGRLYEPDRRDRDYPLTSSARRIPIEKYWPVDHVLNQRSTPHCVAFSGAHYLAAPPIRNTLRTSKAALYRECQKVDQWPGEDYEGTSVRALFKVLKRRGFVSEYRWAFDVDTLIKHLLTVGPVVMGTTWYDNMSDPQPNGIIRPVGDSVGGHAYVLEGGNRKKEVVRVLNSWGPGWGIKGRAWMTFTALQVLLEQNGEACVSSEILAG